MLYQKTIKYLVFAFITSIILLTLFSCENYYDIRDSSMPVIQDKDTLVFINEALETEMFVIEKNVGYETTDNRHDEYCVIKYHRIVNDSLQFRFLGGGIFATGVDLNTIYEIVNTGHDAYYYFPGIDTREPVKTYTQDGFIYADTYMLDTLKPKNQNYYPLENASVTKAWYSLKYGIIRYKTKDGEDFKIIRN
jgi:hypothetical protein